MIRHIKWGFLFQFECQSQTPFDLTPPLSTKSSKMHFSFTLAAIGALTSTAIAQDSTTAQTASRTTSGIAAPENTLPAEDGFTTTRIFAPFNVGGAYITPIGSEGNTTTYGADVFTRVLASPTTIFTLGPSTAIHTRPLNG